MNRDKVETPQGDLDLQPPDRSVGDTAHVAVRSLLGAIPFLGQTAVELFNGLVTPPFEKRFRAWQETIGQAIHDLHQRGVVDATQLLENESFVTVLIETSYVAARTHRVEKHEALRNAVLNAAASQEPSDDFRVIFVRYLDDLSPGHVGLLGWIADQEVELANESSYEILQHHALHQGGLKFSRDEFRFFFRDLERRGLLRVSEDVEDFADVREAPRVTASGGEQGPLLRVTEIGRAFLDFIREGPAPNPS